MKYSFLQFSLAISFCFCLFLLCDIWCPHVGEQCYKGSFNHSVIFRYALMLSFKKWPRTWSRPTGRNHDNTRWWTISPWCCVCSRKACCIGVWFKGQTKTLGAGQPQQSQIVSSTLTLELLVNHHLLWGESLRRRPNTHHVPGWIAAKPGGKKRWKDGKLVDVQWSHCTADSFKTLTDLQLCVGFTCWYSMQTSGPSKD